MRLLNTKDVKLSLVTLGLGTMAWYVVQTSKNWLNGVRERRRLTNLRLTKQEELRRAKEAYLLYLQMQNISEAEVFSLTSQSVAELITALRMGEIQPRRLFLAFQLRAAAVDARTNCVVEFLPEPQDWLTAASPDTPLAGLPFSVKESLGMAGRDSCAGCALYVHQPICEDCATVSLMRSLGGVPFVRTVLPQSGYSVLSSNPIDGTVLHPENSSRCPGGSSSGEAVLVASGASPLGVGTDIGGSARLPAAWCGCVGFKPSVGRLTYLSNRAIASQQLVRAVVGPLARDVATVVLFMREMCNSTLHQQLDPTIPRLPFDESTFHGDGRPMRIGYFEYNEVFLPVPAMQRATRLARDALIAAGHEIVPVCLPNQKELYELYIRSVLSDGGQFIKKLLQFDVCDPSLTNTLSILLMPLWRRRLLGLAAKLTGQKSAAMFLNLLNKQHSIADLWNHALHLRTFCRNIILYCQHLKLDALLCPAMGCPAVPIKSSHSFTGALTYVNLFNVLGHAAGSVPVTRVLPQDISREAMRSYEMASPKNCAWHKNVRLMQEGSEGLPVGVQCAAVSPWADEACLRLMAEVERLCPYEQRSLI